MPPTIHGSMSGKNGISTDKTVFLSLLAGETRLCPDKSPMLRRANAHQLPPGRGHCLTKARCSLCRRRTRAHSAVADNTLTIKQKSTLLVSKTRQDKSLFCSLPGTYLPPLESGFVSHLLCGHLALMDFRRRLRHYYRPPASACARHPFYMATYAAATAACGPALR